MDGGLQQAISLLIGAAASVILLWGNYQFGGRRRADELERKHHEHCEHDEHEHCEHD